LFIITYFYIGSQKLQLGGAVPCYDILWPLNTPFVWGFSWARRTEQVNMFKFSTQFLHINYAVYP